MTATANGTDLLEKVETLRLEAGRQAHPDHKANLGQFLTPSPVAQKMASMLAFPGKHISILDAGCGIGSLFAACIAKISRREHLPERISVIAYEVDPVMHPYLRQTVQLCRAECERIGIEFAAEIHSCDFIKSAVSELQSTLFDEASSFRYNCVILNPPYRKIHSQSQERKLLRQIGVETSNLYTGFLAAAIRLLEPSGELVAITPRSFCNGPYFKTFRRDLLHRMTLRRVHLYESRETAFRDDNVLQENIIFAAVKESIPTANVVISTSSSPSARDEAQRAVAYEDVLSPTDPQSFIHLPNRDDGMFARQIKQLPCTLNELGIEVSTGRVVDFRAKEWLRLEPEPGTAPLIYPTHLDAGIVTWPKGRTRKPCALAISDYINPQLVPNTNYVLVKRFSTKEETKRIVATVYEASRVPGTRVGFENHLNYFHSRFGDLSLPLVKGLAAFLNSTIVDSYFRQFNGHTQVNATDLRSLRYPTVQQLIDIGGKISTRHSSQNELDTLLQKELFCIHE